MSNHLYYTAGGSLVLGGVMAMLKKRSLPSFVASLSFGGMYLLAGYFIHQGNYMKGHQLAAVTSGLLSASMTHRLMKAPKKTIPGLVATLGFTVLGYSSWKIWQLYQDGFSLRPE
eukprot:TRINITY_DN7315_c0_g1_i1.p1 TRINITY_DN7315_c0_g1~~TRINITY_DN7315_c0_g1_i1.p1  ORF type:complete len:115 (-),score=14.39 TRINITY_DN7315_c0_g1_i1:24-368(-)